MCAPDARTTLLDVLLTPGTPTPPFNVAPKTTVWSTITRMPASTTGLFGDIGSPATIHYIASGAVPAIVVQPNGDTSNDPFILLDRPPGWKLLPIQSGAWQVYSLDDPGIMVVACPTSG